MKRTHYCGQLDESFKGETVQVCGWVNKRRDHGGIIFIDCRDRTGLLQVVFNPGQEALFKEAESLRNEYVIAVQGKLFLRPEGTENRHLSSGKEELHAEQLTLSNNSLTPPFSMDETVSEEVALRYRYLYLRRRDMQARFLLRTKVVSFMRRFLEEQGFLDIETPILTKVTPEGARD